MIRCDQRCGDPAAPCHLLQRPRLNVSVRLEQSNRALRRTQDSMHGFVRVSGLPQLGFVLERLRGCPVVKAERTLDLVAHANSNGILVLGSSTLAPRERELESFAREHRGALAALGFVRLRLVGCYTAAGRASHEAMSHLRDILGVDVYGCTDFVDECYFDVDGFSRKYDALLARA